MTNKGIHGSVWGFLVRYEKFTRHDGCSISGFSSGGMDYGMVGGKEAGTESRFKQWTSMMEGLPSVATQEANMHKNGKSKPTLLAGALLTLSGFE